MTSNGEKKSEDLLVTIWPCPSGNAVAYCCKIQIPLSIRNNTAESILVDRLALRFEYQSTWKSAASETIVEHACDGSVILPDKEYLIRIEVMPTPLFSAGTNAFDVTVRYRRASSVGHSLTHNCSRLTGAYVVINDPVAELGKVFVSYKEPEDLRLKDVLSAILRRAGFDPYAAPDDLEPGSWIWEEKIPSAIRSSKALFVIWTKRTCFGTGVSREVEIARKAGVREIPLIESNVPTPPEYDSMNLELTWFDENIAPSEFCKAVLAVRSGFRA